MMIAAEWLAGWGVGVARPETSSIAAIGSKLKILPISNTAPWPPGIEVCTSADGATWGSWTAVEMNAVTDITYPGYFKLRARDSGAQMKYYNYKTPSEADSITGLTVVLGEASIA